MSSSQEQRMLGERSDDQAILAAALRYDLGTFVAKCFQTVSPGDRYMHNWHIDAVIHSLMQVHAGANRRLIITQPPRSLKSICASVAFVAWSLGHDPSKRFACVSYSNELAATFARQFRVVVTSGWYRALFPQVWLAKDTETECVTTKGGGRFAVPVGGSFTGRGADVIIIDDPMKADDAQSEKARCAVNEWYGTTLLSRLDDKEDGFTKMTSQANCCRTAVGGISTCRQLLKRTKRFRSVFAALIGATRARLFIPNASHWALLEKMKHEMGSLAFSAQYQQRPVPLEGNLVKRDWINWYETAPACETGAQIVQSWDVASTMGENSDWSVCTTWLMIKRDYFLLDVWRGRLEFPHLKRKVIALAAEYRPRRILIEQTGPGLHLVQEFRTNPISGVPVPVGIKPEGDKCVRMEAQKRSLRSRSGSLA